MLTIIFISEIKNQKHIIFETLCKFFYSKANYQQYFNGYQKEFGFWQKIQLKKSKNFKNEKRI